MSAYIRWLVAQKRAWHYPADADEATLGFRGWHTRGYLPHFDAPGVIQMLNFRLADALPQERQHEWEAILRVEEDRERRIRLEDYLDQGYGGCELAVPGIAERVENILLYDDQRRCRLLAWVLMPNHVHTLVEIGTTPVSKLVHSWKILSTKFANETLGRTARWWQGDYFDRYICDRDHFHKAVHYIENNPVRAGLIKDAKQWRWSSARWRPDGYGLQPVQTPDPAY